MNSKLHHHRYTHYTQTTTIIIIISYGVSSGHRGEFWLCDEKGDTNDLQSALWSLAFTNFWLWLGCTIGTVPERDREGAELDRMSISASPFSTSNRVYPPQSCCVALSWPVKGKSLTLLVWPSLFSQSILYLSFSLPTPSHSERS